MKRFYLFFLTGTVFVFTSCSSLGSVYIKDNYLINSDNMVKKVMVIVRVPDKHPESAILIADISADIIKLRTNYLVYGYKTVKSEGLELECGKDVQGVFIFSVKHAEVKDSKVRLDLTGELYSCSSKELLWKANASNSAESGNEDLKELTVEYEKKYNTAARTFAAPAFMIVQDIVESIPNPELSDDEIDIKIKLDAGK